MSPRHHHQPTTNTPVAAWHYPSQQMSADTCTIKNIIQIELPSAWCSCDRDRFAWNGINQAGCENADLGTDPHMKTSIMDGIVVRITHKLGRHQNRQGRCAKRDDVLLWCAAAKIPVWLQLALRRSKSFLKNAALNRVRSKLLRGKK